jgi:hypothetical protein
VFFFFELFGVLGLRVLDRGGCVLGLGLRNVQLLVVLDHLDVAEGYRRQVILRFPFNGSVFERGFQKVEED